MAIHVRNLLSTQSPATYRGWSHWIFMLRELFLAGRWTENANDGDIAWTNNLLATGVAATVRASVPLRITGLLGMTGQEGNALTLLATLDQNRGVYKIRRVIGDTEVELYQSNAPPDGWVDQIGTLSWRLTDWGYTDQFDAGDYFVMDPPGGTVQAHLAVSTNVYQLKATAYPLGDWATAKTATTTYTILCGGLQEMRFHAYFDGANSTALIYCYDVAHTVIHFGELTNVVTADINPGFLCSSYSATKYLAFGMFNDYLGQLRMLDHLGGQIDGYHSTLVMGSWYLGTEQITKLNTRLPSGQIKDVRPWVTMANVAAGGYIRGRTPLLRSTNENWFAYQQIDAAGTKRIAAHGTVFPMNGVNDPLPLESVTD